MGSIFNPPQPPPLPPPPPVTTPDDPAIDEARQRLRKAELSRKGRRSTILTSGLGDSSVAPARRTNLSNRLGGN
jgi:hypothetical protein